MCIAILNVPYDTLVKRTITNSYKANPDGTGFIWVEDGRLMTHKTMEGSKKVWKMYKEIRQRAPKSYIVLHFRIATSGGINLENCHPFKVNSDLAFVHNGIISGLGSLKQSDTNEFNQHYLQKLPERFLESEGIVRLIEDTIGHSKLVFLDKDNEPNIINSDLGSFDIKGNWYSNDTYLDDPYEAYYNKYYSTYGKKASVVDYSQRNTYDYGDFYDEDDKKWVRNEDGGWDEVKKDVPAVKHYSRTLNSYLNDCEGCNQPKEIHYCHSVNAYLCSDCQSYFEESLPVLTAENAR